MHIHSAKRSSPWTTRRCQAVEDRGQGCHPCTKCAEGQVGSAARAETSCAPPRPSVEQVREAKVQRFRQVAVSTARQRVLHISTRAWRDEIRATPQAFRSHRARTQAPVFGGLLGLRSLQSEDYYPPIDGRRQLARLPPLVVRNGVGQPKSANQS